MAIPPSFPPHLEHFGRRLQALRLPAPHAVAPALPTRNNLCCTASSVMSQLYCNPSPPHHRRRFKHNCRSGNGTIGRRAEGSEEAMRVANEMQRLAGYVVTRIAKLRRPPPERDAVFRNRPDLRGLLRLLRFSLFWSLSRAWSLPLRHLPAFGWRAGPG